MKEFLCNSVNFFLTDIKKSRTVQTLSPLKGGNTFWGYYDFILSTQVLCKLTNGN